MLKLQLFLKLQLISCKTQAEGPAEAKTLVFADFQGLGLAEVQTVFLADAEVISLAEA